MSKKKSKQKREGIVFSTDPEFEYDEGMEEEESLAPQHQDLRIRLDRLKGNKVATVITGFQGNEDNLKELGKELKQKCGCGGSVKNGEIILQGDFRKKAGEYLQSEGYKYKFSGG